MKKPLPFLLFCISLCAGYGQSGTAFKLALHYSESERPELETYLNILSDTMQIGGSPNVQPGFGFSIGFLAKSNHIEFEAGGGYTRSADEVGTESANLMYYANSDIDIYLGVNYVPVNFFLVGGNFVINSANAKCNETGAGQGEKFLELLPAKNFHVLRGYSVALKAQSGFYIPLSKDDFKRLRLTGYYIYGLSKYNFYTVSELRLKDYTADQKTGYQTMGIELAVLLGE